MRQSKVYVTGDERVEGGHAKAPLFQVARRLSSEWEDSMPDERWIITDELWDLVEPLIAKKQRRFRYPGCTRLPDREVLCGNLFVLRTGKAAELEAVRVFLAAGGQTATHRV